MRACSCARWSWPDAAGTTTHTCAPSPLPFLSPAPLSLAWPIPPAGRPSRRTARRPSWIPPTPCTSATEPCATSRSSGGATGRLGTVLTASAGRCSSGAQACNRSAAQPQGPGGLLAIPLAAGLKRVQHLPYVPCRLCAALCCIATPSCTFCVPSMCCCLQL